MTAGEGGCAVLTTPDGTAYPLDRAYVIGRFRPGEAPRCRNAAPILVHNDPFVCRIHAYVWVHRGAVFVCDAATPGGTFVTPPGARVWHRVGATPVELLPGGSLLVGSRILTYRLGSRNRSPSSVALGAVRHGRSGSSYSAIRPAIARSEPPTREPPDRCRRTVF